MPSRNARLDARRSIGLCSEICHLQLFGRGRSMAGRRQFRVRDSGTEPGVGFRRSKGKPSCSVVQFQLYMRASSSAVRHFHGALTSSHNTCPEPQAARLEAEQLVAAQLSLALGRFGH